MPDGRLRAYQLRNSGLIDRTVGQPIFTVRQVERHLELTYARANGLVGQLVTIGVLRQYDEARYDRRFTAPEILAVLSERPDAAGVAVAAGRRMCR